MSGLTFPTRAPAPLRRLAAAAAIALGAPAVLAQPSISQYPMLVDSPPPANVVLTIDDSGSMTWGYIPDAVGNFDNTAGFASNAYNTAYYNPCAVYANPLDGNGVLVPLAQTNPATNAAYPLTSFTNAYFDGFHPSYGALDLSGATGPGYLPTRSMSYPVSVTTANVTNPTASPGSRSNGSAYYYIPVPPAGVSYSCSATATTGAVQAFPSFNNSQPPPADSTFQPVAVSATSGIGPAGADERQNFANWYTFYRTRHLAIVSAASLAMQDPSLQNIRVAWQALNTCSDFSGTNCRGWLNDSFDNRISQFANQHRQDFFNWLFEIPAANYTPTRTAWWRVGQYFSNQSLGGNSPYGVNPNGSLSVASGQTATASTTELLCTNNFNVTLTDGLWNQQSDTQSNFCGLNNANPPGSCSNTDNSSATYPDGVNYSPTTASTLIYGDGSNGADTQIGNGALSDIAFFYWSTNLRPDLKGYATPPYFPNQSFNNPWTGASSDTAWPYWNPQNDPATWPHLVNFTVGVGLTGFLSLPGLPWTGDALAGTAYTNLYQQNPSCLPPSVTVTTPATTPPANNPCVWPDVLPNASGGGFTGGYQGAGNVYDLWHAAINSRGDAYSASSPTDLVNALASIFTRVEGQTIGNTAATGSSSSLTASTQLFVASYDGSDWHGTVTAYSINTSNGSVNGTPSWQTSAASIPAFGSRLIFTAATPLPDNTSAQSTSSTVGIPFDYNDLYNNLPAAYLLYFGDGPSDQKNVISYLMGDPSQEQRNGGNFRNRSVTVLGDIVDSSPTFAGDSDFGYAVLSTANGGGTYQSYLSTRQNSGQPLAVYAGANDGMLHAFDSSSGNELFAYVPHSVLHELASETAPIAGTGLPPNLKGLVNPKYMHAFNVDGQVSVSDAYIGVAGGTPNWRSVLVGTTGAGGPGVFALDVTSPGQFGAANVLWDLDGNAATLTAANGSTTIGQDINLGYTIGQATIGFLNDGNWYAIFGNGYLSARGCAVLYLVRLDTGQVHVIDTSGAASGSTAPCTNASGNALYNGLGTPSLLDLDQNGTTDFVYAGDLQGNLWKFDLTNSDSTRWQVAYGTPTAPQPLFTAINANNVNQPIVAAPNFGPSPGVPNAYLVYVVTGHMFYVGDEADTTVQSVYAVQDSGSAITNGRTTLVQQTVSAVAGTGPAGGLNDENVVSPYPNVSLTSANGWYLDLPNAGERALEMPNLVGGMILFSTVVPNAQTCNGACKGSLVYALNQFNGDGGMNYLLDPSTNTYYDALATSVGCVKGLTLITLGSTLNLYASGNGASANSSSNSPVSVTGGTPSVNFPATNSGSGSAADIAHLAGQMRIPGRVSWHEKLQ